jgi:hypothetical protein
VMGSACPIDSVRAVVTVSRVATVALAGVFEGDSKSLVLNGGGDGAGERASRGGVGGSMFPEDKIGDVVILLAMTLCGGVDVGMGGSMISISRLWGSLVSSSVLA